MKQLENQKEANALRLELLAGQDNICPVTGYYLTMENSALDHDHFTGQIRGVLFSGANRVLQDRQWVRYGIRKEGHITMLRRMADYLETEQLDVMHHSFQQRPPVVQVSSHKKLERLIMHDKGRLPSWWGYVYSGRKKVQKLSKRLKALYEKYNIEPEFYKR